MCPGPGVTASRRLAGCAQLTTRTLGEPEQAEGLERLRRLAERRPRFGHAVLPPEPGAVRELGARREVRPILGSRAHRGCVERLRICVGREHGLHVPQLDLQAGCTRGRGNRLPLVHDPRHLLEVAVAVQRRVRQVRQRPAADELLVGGVPWIEDPQQVRVRLGEPLLRERLAAACQRDL